MIIYSFLFTRDTLTDFIALSLLCILLYFFGSKAGLKTPVKAAISTKDYLLAIATALLFISPWIYAFISSKINTERFQTSFIISIVYIYYAFIQHFLAQRYLSLRLYSLTKKKQITGINKLSPEISAALLSSVIFGLLHITYPHLIVISGVIGFIYSYYYLTTGRLSVVVCSHAFIASSSLYWYLDDNPFLELLIFTAQ